MPRLSTNLDKIQKTHIKKVKGVNNDNETFLLLTAAKEDLSILHKIGLDHKLTFDSKAVEEVRAIEHYNNTIGKTYNGNTIREMCIEYDLKIDRAVEFRAGINSEVVKQINIFCEKNKIIPVYNSFYVLGPSEYFDKPLDVTENCILFYKDSFTHVSSINESDRLTEICNWGGSHSYLRKFRFLFNDEHSYDVTTKNFTWTSIAFFILGCLIGFKSMSVGFGFIIIGAIILILNGLIKKEELEWN